MIAAVIDCSALVELMSKGGLAAVRAHPELSECLLGAPHLVDAEFVNAVRQLARRNPELVDRFEQLLVEFHRLDLTRFEHAPLTWEAWRLRDRVTAYDGMYVALAADLGVPLITSDRRLARAARGTCDVRLLEELSAA
ncbi:type II toxin-antitoxin system VapC family toxin [Leifsonia poae]|uniref:type II toxin-antitoxin system VapC family toxin n=1 Tax=Leifsonia poae TaxID=110933 RepID=UPI003D6856C1